MLWDNSSHCTITLSANMSNPSPPPPLRPPAASRTSPPPPPAQLHQDRCALGITGANEYRLFVEAETQVYPVCADSADPRGLSACQNASSPSRTVKCTPTPPAPTLPRNAHPLHLQGSERDRASRESEGAMRPYLSSGGEGSVREAATSLRGCGWLARTEDHAVAIQNGQTIGERRLCRGEQLQSVIPHPKGGLHPAGADGLRFAAMCIVRIADQPALCTAFQPCAPRRSDARSLCLITESLSRHGSQIGCLLAST